MYELVFETNYKSLFNIWTIGMIILLLLFLYANNKKIINFKCNNLLVKYFHKYLRVIFLLIVSLPLIIQLILVLFIKINILNKTYSIVEGNVSNFKRGNCKKPFKEESFSVNNVSFKYMPEYQNSLFFKKGSCYGGPIRQNGQQVKIYYIKLFGNNKIIKLWIGK